MNKKIDFVEHLKTVILVVLFLITILLLYLCFNQHGTSFSISEIFPGGRNITTSVNASEYLYPEYVLKANGDGTYELAFGEKEEILSATNESMQSLIASSAAAITEIEETEFSKASLEKDAIQVVFGFDIPYADFSKKLVERELEIPSNLKSFSVVLFSDNAKDCFYLKDKANHFFKLTAGENYYATNRFANALVFESKTLNHFANVYDVNKILASYNMLPQISRSDFNSEEIAEHIFGDTFDFVRKIKDNFGNETYMYGYGQKRFSIDTDGTMEYKIETANVNVANFYSDLDTALAFLSNTVGLEEHSFKLKSAELIADGASNYYRFIFSDGTYSVSIDVFASQVSYFLLKEENLGAIWIGRELKAY